MWSIRNSVKILLTLFVILALPSPAQSQQQPQRLVVATWNLEWFFDENQGDNYSELAKKLSAPTRRDWEWKRNAVAEAIAAMKPDILALQEVENQQVLYYLCQRLRKEHNQNYRIAFVGGSDYFTEQDVAILYRDGMLEFGRKLPSSAQFASDDFYYLSKHQFAKFRLGAGADAETLVLLNLHLRARAEAANLRQRQARLARTWIDDFLRETPNVIVLGDFNTEEPASPNPSSEIAIFRGLNVEETRTRLDDAHRHIPAAEHSTHLVGKPFDRILFSDALRADDSTRRDLVFESATVRKDLCVRGKPDTDHRDIYYKIDERERDLSDHYPIVATFVWR